MLADTCYEWQLRGVQSIIQAEWHTWGLKEFETMRPKRSVTEVNLYDVNNHIIKPRCRSPFVFYS